MKIFILTEGGRDIGIGHIKRCVSLYQAFEERGISPVFIINGDDNMGDLLSGGKYQIFNWLKEENKLFEIIEGASMVVIDSYLAEAEAYRKVSESVEVTVCIDDNKSIDYPDGFVVNGTLY